MMPTTAKSVESTSKNAESSDEGPLSSWNDGSAKTAIIEYVSEITDSCSPHYIRPEERIAVFDNDGTMCSERPSQFMLLFMQERIIGLEPKHPEWKSEEPLRSLLSGKILSMSSFSEKDILNVYAATWRQNNSR